VVRAFNEFHDRLLQQSTRGLDAVLQAVPDELRQRDGVDLVDLIQQDAARKLPERDAVQLARGLLVAFAEQPAFEPVVLEALRDWKDDRMLVDIVLSVGAVGAVWLCLASLGFSIKLGNRTVIEKTPIDDKQLIGFADVIRALWRVKPDSGNPQTSFNSPGH
jgi:hypothetical protein